MNKFQELISGNGNSVLARRASTLATQAEIAQQTLVNTLKQKKSELEMTITNLTDLAPESTDSLRPGSKDWNATNWAIELQRTKFELWQVNKQLELANETYNEYFIEQ